MTQAVPLAVLATLLAIAPATTAAQGGVDFEAARLYATRASLQELLDQLELTQRSSAYSANTLAEAAAHAARIRQRLEDGDFQTGDRIYLVVEGETTLTDTFPVRPGPFLELPAVGTISLRGVLRAELRGHLRTELARFIRDPVVQARTLIRVSVLGEVGAPGFYMVPTEGLVTDVITRAGGPTRDARLDGITIERQGAVIWDAEPLELAIIEGRTLDQLNLRAGDRLVVPRSGRGIAGVEGTARTVAVLLSIPLTIFAITQLF